LKRRLIIKLKNLLKTKLLFQKLLNEFKGKLNAVIDRKSEKSVKKHIERGKLLARDRIELLIDKNTPFLELSALAANGMYDDSFPSAGNNYWNRNSSWK
jgi:3-methylcrotonyl-CoA carboxylase beta subunit